MGRAPPKTYQRDRWIPRRPRREHNHRLLCTLPLFHLNGAGLRAAGATPRWTSAPRNACNDTHEEVTPIRIAGSTVRARASRRSSAPSIHHLRRLLRCPGGRCPPHMGALQERPHPGYQRVRCGVPPGAAVVANTDFGTGNVTKAAGVQIRYTEAIRHYKFSSTNQASTSALARPRSK
jgi:hypothetical protein